MNAPKAYSGEHPPHASLALKMVAASWLVAVSLIAGTAIWQWVAG